MPLATPSRPFHAPSTRNLFNSHARKYIENEKILRENRFPLPMLDNDSTNIFLPADYVEEYFKVISAAYENLYFAVKWEEYDREFWDTANDVADGVAAGVALGLMIANCWNPAGWGMAIAGALIAVGQAIRDAVETKSRKFPSEVHLLEGIIESSINFAKIKPHNKHKLRGGVRNYIEMQKEEYNDYVKEDEYVPLTSSYLETILYTILPQFKYQVERIAKVGSKPLEVPILDNMPQAPGKDFVNEIDYARNPRGDMEAEAKRRTSQGNSDGAILDFIRNRHSSEKAGGEKYDYEFSKEGFNIELVKVQEYNNVGQFAKQVSIEQTIKGMVLMICSNHYCYHYKATNTIHDECDVRSNIPTDMKEEEINPHIKRFNNESSFQAQKARLSRYSQGLQPSTLNDLKLDLIDESTKGYYKKWLKYYSQGFTGDYIEYDKERNLLYFKDVEKEVELHSSKVYGNQFKRKEELQKNKEKIYKEAIEQSKTEANIDVVFLCGVAVGESNSDSETGEVIESVNEHGIVGDKTFIAKTKAKYFLADSNAEYFRDDIDYFEKEKVYFDIRTELLSVDLIHSEFKVYEEHGQGFSGYVTYYEFKIKQKYKLIYNKRIFKDTLQKEVAKAEVKAAQSGKAQKEKDNIDKIIQAGI